MALRTARTSIYIDAVKFFNIAYEGQFEMDKHHKIMNLDILPRLNGVGFLCASVNC